MKKLAPTLLALAISHQASATVQPVNLVEYITPQQDFMVTEVFNGDDKTAFVRVEAEEVIDFKNENIDRRKINEVEGDNIAIVPSKFITPADSSSSVKVYFTEGREKDRLYRLKYVPVRGKERAEFVGSEDYKEETTAAIGIDLVISQGVLVPKKNPTYSYTITNNNGEIVATNTGDSYIRLTNMNKCTSKGKCVSLGDTTVFADSAKEIVELDKNEFLEGEIFVGGEVIEINAKYSDKVIAKR
ncbi:hypothetical protein ACED51_19850 [Photobacterium swingsii]|uniref:hypothetical protein n=1 Tax=Photobacterium swingsii TaxID=680026 RepID=UPI00352D15F3